MSTSSWLPSHTLIRTIYYQFWLTGPPHIHTGLIQACKVISHKMDTADRRKKGKDSKPVSAARLLSDIIKIFVDLQTPLYPQPKFIHYEAKVHPWRKIDQTWADCIISRHFHLLMKKASRDPSNLQTPKAKSGKVWSTHSPGVAARAIVPKGTLSSCFQERRLRGKPAFYNKKRGGSQLGNPQDLPTHQMGTGE